MKLGKCADCGLNTDELYADHIDPVVDPQKGWVDWNEYISRMFGGKLQPLCADCHKRKTNEETAERKKARKLQKAKCRNV